MTSNLDEEGDNESWGMRDVKLSFRPCPKDCGLCHNNDPRACYFWEQMALSWIKPEVAIEGWTLENGNPRSNNCAGINIFGGYGNIGR